MDDVPPPWMTPDEIDGLVTAAQEPSEHGPVTGYHVAYFGSYWRRTSPPETDVWRAVWFWLTFSGYEWSTTPLTRVAFCRRAGGVEEELVPAWSCGEWRRFDEDCGGWWLYVSPPPVLSDMLRSLH